MATFACFDVETTRLDPTDGRVIEVAVVRVERDGAPAGESVSYTHLTLPTIA